MEANYRIEKEYTIPYDIFKDAYTAFQKKNIYPRTYLFMGLFIVLAVIYIFAAVDDPSNKLSYVLIFVCLALAVREWYNPRKIRRTLLDTIRSEGLENEVYRLCVGDDFLEISTLPHENVENSEPEPQEESAEDDDSGYEEDEHPEKSVIPINSELSVQEHDEFFLIHIRKKMFYVVPKKDFSEPELEIIRGLNADAAGK
ncbi:MAG: YcxB family protein [Ruminococcus sp.]|nr:YcxB family protein [Ruminococcus sp.]